MSSAFKRKTYGPVKPVKKPKLVPPTKPSTLILHGLYRSISKASLGQHLDYFAKALYWWQDAVAYVRHKRPIEKENSATTRDLLSAYEWVRKGQNAKTNDEKERCFVSAMNEYRLFAAQVLPTTSVIPFIKTYKENNKKTVKIVQTLAPRFDPFLTLLSQCFRSCPYTFQVVPLIDGQKGLTRKFDHALGKMFYSRTLALLLMKKLRSQGILPVVIDEARHLSRAMAYVGTDKGAFLVDKEKQFLSYTQLMDDFVQFAQTSPDCPNRLVRRSVDAPKRPKRVPRIKLPHEQSLNEALLEELALDVNTSKGVSK